MLRATAILTVALVLATPTIPAATIFTSGPPAAVAPIGLAISDSVTTAATFALTGPATIESVTFASIDLPVASPTIAWAFYANAGGTVGALLASGVATSSWTFGVEPVGYIGDENYSFDAGGFNIPATTLGAGSYWLAINDSGNPTLVNSMYARLWAGAASTPGNSIAQEANGVWQYSRGDAVSFQLQSVPFTPVMFPVPAPEPGSLVMMGIGGVCLGIARLLRRCIK